MCIRDRSLVLLLDVLVQQAHVSFGSLSHDAGPGLLTLPVLLQTLFHGGYVGAPLVVLVQHHCHRTTLRGEAGFAHGREEDLLFLGVVRAVGVFADEVTSSANTPTALTTPRKRRSSSRPWAKPASPRRVVRWQ